MGQTKYKLPSSRKKSGGPFIYWLLALAAAVILGWLWWHDGKLLPGARKRATVVTKPTPTRIIQRPVVVTPPVKAVVVNSNVAPPKLVSSPASVAVSTNGFPRAVQNPFEAQVALAREGISSGSIDGALGSQTRAALMAYQRQKKLPQSGELDAATKSSLELDDAPYTIYTITSNDLARLHPVPTTWLAKSQEASLDYETALELVAEKSFSHPNLIRRLNPQVNWTNVLAGTTVQVPDVEYPDVTAKAAWIVIHLSGKTLEAFDAETNLIVHFPCSIARRVEKRPVGELHVVAVAPNPNYTFDPEVFPESPEAHEIKHKLIIPPGPNNPVGVAWIGLDRPGYGMHGTPHPEEVGRTESHGCFRLANWNAEYLVRLVTIGTPVYVVE